MDNTNTVIELRESFKGNDYQEPLSIIKGHQDQIDIKDILLKADIEQRSYLMEHESKEILEGFGIQTSGGMIAKDERDAVEIARYLGYPVVLKIASPDVVHKSDLGGVKLDLRNDFDVKKAYNEIVSQFKGRDITGVSVQKMVSPGMDAIIGVTHDETFGPVIMFGLGGVFVEVLKDVSFRVLPITEEMADEMIKEIRGYPLLKGYRGRSADIQSLRELLLKVSNLITMYPQIRELDMNPVVLYPSGYMVIDARVFIGQPYHLPEKPVTITPLSKDSLYRLFYPQGIAVLGATDSEGKLGFNVMRNLIAHNFPSKLYPVNPRKESILGIRSYSSILDIKEPVDTAIIIVPAEAVPAAIRECCEKGVRYIIVESAGFAETGEAGLKLQSEIRELIRKNGCRLLGPNCSGIINTHHSMVQSIGIVDQLDKGNVGLIAQAGVYAAGMLYGLRHVMDFGIIATIGNKIDVDEADILEFMETDPNIDVIALYQEDMSSARRFLEVAGRVSEKKPIIVLKTGRTEAGKRVVSSHTASMAGKEEINNAVFKQTGIIRARDNEHLFSLIRGFSRQPLPKGRGVLVITYTGSLGVATTDMLYSNNLKLAELEGHLKKRLAPSLDKYLNVQNPVDCSFSMNPEQVKRITEIGILSKNVHAIIVILQGEMLDSYIDTLKAIDYKGKPVLCCVACKEFMMDQVIRLEKAGIPVYSTPEMAVEVLAAMYQYARRHMVKDINQFLAQNSFSIDDQQVTLRMLSHQDMTLWTGFVNACSPRALWYRFLSPFKATPEVAERFCAIDPDEEVAIVAEIVENDKKRIVAIARLIKCRDCDEAEYAVIVTDSWQKKRLGYKLSLTCVNLARHLGINRINAETIDENLPIIKVLNRCSFKMEAKERNMLLMSLNLKT